MKNQHTKQRVLFDTKKMNRESLKKAILEDMLSFYFSGRGATLYDLLECVEEEEKERVEALFFSSDIQRFFYKTGQVYVLLGTKKNLQEVMEITGVWYESFSPVPPLVASNQ